jgi:hypothetical protein
MSANWKKGYNIGKIVQKLEAIKKYDNSGKVQFSGFQFDDYSATLNNLLELDHEVPDSEKN